MRLRMPPAGFLLPLASALATAFWLTGRDNAADVPAPTIAANAAGPDGSALALPPPSDVTASLAAFADRPLLAENRRLPEPVPVDAPQVEPDMQPEPMAEAPPEDLPLPPPEPPRIEAAGVMSLNGETRILLRNLEDGTESWAAQGDRISDWTLVEITQTGALLESQGVQITIQLF
jgi:hypothetical protein